MRTINTLFTLAGCALFANAILLSSDGARVASALYMAGAVFVILAAIAYNLSTVKD